MENTSRYIREHRTRYADEFPQEEEIDFVEERPVIVHDAVTERNVALYRVYQTIWFILGTIETLLLFRFILKLIGASTASGFTNFIYGITNPFAVPFMGVVPASVSSASIIEWTTLLAMAVYFVIAYGVFELIKLLTPVHRDERYQRPSRFAF